MLKYTSWPTAQASTHQVTLSFVACYSPQADILDMALMDGAPVLGTVSDDGEACVWSIESGALRRRMIPDNHK
jgi:hypothetical protein